MCPFTDALSTVLGDSTEQTRSVPQLSWDHVNHPSEAGLPEDEMCALSLTDWTSLLSNYTLQRTGSFLFEIMGLAGTCNTQPPPTIVTENHTARC